MAGTTVRQLLRRPCPAAIMPLLWGFTWIEYARRVFRWQRLESLFSFVSSNCNSRCRTCFHWAELNHGRDLNFLQIERLSVTESRFHKLWISGGEPFLRRELAEIVVLFYGNNGVRHVNRPTNGLLSGRVETVVSQLLDHCPELTIDLNRWQRLPETKLTELERFRVTDAPQLS